MGYSSSFSGHQLRNNGSVSLTLKDLKGVKNTRASAFEVTIDTTRKDPLLGLNQSIPDIGNSFTSVTRSGKTEIIHENDTILPGVKSLKLNFDPTHPDYSWDVTPRSERSSSSTCVGPSSPEDSTPLETLVASSSTGLSGQNKDESGRAPVSIEQARRELEKTIEEREAKRRIRDAQRKERWLKEHEIEAEKQREYERRKKEEEKKAAAYAAMLEEKKLEEEARIKRVEDAKRLETFLDEQQFVGVNSKTKKEARSWGRYEYPLHRAVDHGNIEMVRILLDFGAQPDLKNSQKCTPLQKAIKNMKSSSDWEKLQSISTLLENANLKEQNSLFFRSNVSTAASYGLLTAVR